MQNIIYWPGIDFPMIMSYKDTENQNFEPYYYYFLNGHNDVEIASLSLATGFDTGLQFNRMRYYSPSLGRFYKKDKLFCLQCYIYANNNPLNYYDPIGLEWGCWSEGCYVVCICWHCVNFRTGMRCDITFCWIFIIIKCYF